MAAINLGNIAEDATVYFLWSTNAADGTSVSRDVVGTIRVYKNNSETFTTIGITELRDFDSMIGIHNVQIDTSVNAFYATAADYSVVIYHTGIDDVTNINAPIAYFSIENRV